MGVRHITKWTLSFYCILLH